MNEEYDILGMECYYWTITGATLNGGYMATKAKFMINIVSNKTKAERSICINDLKSLKDVLLNIEH